MIVLAVRTPHVETRSKHIPIVMSIRSGLMERWNTNTTVPLYALCDTCDAVDALITPPMPMPMPVSVPKVCGSFASYPLHVRRSLGTGFSKHSVLELAWLPLLLCFSWTVLYDMYAGVDRPKAFWCLARSLAASRQHSTDGVHGRHSATTLIIPNLQYSSGGTTQSTSEIPNADRNIHQLPAAAGR